MKRSIACLAALFALAMPARADLLDPANLHVNGPGGFAQSAGGTDWVTLPTFNGTFNVENIDNNQVSVGPWHIVLALPNITGTISDSITQIGTTSVSISASPEVTLNSGSAYDALGISGAPGSVSFGNFQTATQAVAGFTPTTYGLYDFTVTPTSLFLLSKVAENVTIGGNLPAGTVIFAYGVGDDNKLYTTAFTNAGVISTQSVSPTPEPSSLLVAGLGAIGFVTYGLRRPLGRFLRRKRD